MFKASVNKKSKIRKNKQTNDLQLWIRINRPPPKRVTFGKARAHNSVNNLTPPQRMQSRLNTSQGSGLSNFITVCHTLWRRFAKKFFQQYTAQDKPTTLWHLCKSLKILFGWHSKSCMIQQATKWDMQYLPRLWKRKHSENRWVGQTQPHLLFSKEPMGKICIH